MTFAEIERANGGKYPGFAFLRHFLSVVILLHHCRVAVRGERVDPLPDFTLAPGAGIYDQLVAFSHLLASSEVFRPILYALVGSFFALSGFLVAGSAVPPASVTPAALRERVGQLLAS